MTSGSCYLERVEFFFSFLITEFEFKLVKKVENGNVFYDVEYRDLEKVISISYENIEDYFLVIVFKFKNGNLPDFDDKTHTLHLNELNKMVLPKLDKKEVEENNVLFDQFDAKDDFSKKLLKSAKELRLSLKHWHIIEQELKTKDS